MKKGIFISVIIFCSVNVFSQSILIQKKSEPKVSKRNKILSLPVKLYIPSNQVFYNFSNYAELNSDNDQDLNSTLNGLVFHLYDSSYETSWEKGIGVLNLRCLTTDSDSLRFKYDTIKKKVIEYEIYDKIYENRLFSFKTDSCFNRKIYFKTPNIKGNYKLFFTYGQGSLGMKLFVKDSLIKDKDIRVFEGLVYSDTIDIRIK